MIKTNMINLILTIMLGSILSCNKDNNDPIIPEDFDPTKHGDYFVSPSGSDMNLGTYEKPWATWQRAFEMAEPGDTVYFRAGVYKPSTATHGNNITMIFPDGDIGHSGVAGNPISYFCFPGEKPILDCSQVTTAGNFNTGLFLNRVNYIHFRGLTIRYVKQKKDFVECFGIGATDVSNITYENVTIHDVDGNAFRHGGALGYYSEITTDTTRFINCDAFNCCDSLPRTSSSASLGGAADGFKTWNEPGSCFIFDGCRAFNNSDDGFDPGTDPLVIMNNCWSFNNGYLDGDGSGYKTGGMLHSESSNKITRIIINCIAAENIGSGFFLLEYPNYYRTNARFYNNIAFANKKQGFHFSRNEFYPIVLGVWRNNISFENEGNAFDNSYEVYTESHNNWDFIPGFPGWVFTDSVSVSNADFLSVSVNELRNATRSGDHGTLSKVNFMRLSSTSELIGAGIDVGLSKDPDMGIDWAFLDTGEYSGNFTDIE